MSHPRGAACHCCPLMYVEPCGALGRRGGPGRAAEGAQKREPAPRHTLPFPQRTRPPRGEAGVCRVTLTSAPRACSSWVSHPQTFPSPSARRWQPRGTSRHVSEQSRAWGLVQTAGSVVFRLGVLGEATSPAEPPSCLRTRTTPALTPQGYCEPRMVSHAPSAYNKQHPGPRGRYLSGGHSGPPCLCSPLRRVPTRSAAAEASGGQHRDTAGPQ